MKDFNKVILCGTIVSNIHIEKNVAIFEIEVTRSLRGTVDTCRAQVGFNALLGERVKDEFSKGDRIIVEGRLRSWPENYQLAIAGERFEKDV